MGRRIIGALDQGTTSTRFILFNESAEIEASHQLEHRQLFPEPGWVEHDPVEIWRNTCRVIRAALDAGKVHPRRIECLGITNQRETSLAWNRRSGEPYHNAIVWQDTRTKELCRRWEEEAGIDRFREKTGLPVSTYFSASKIVWLLDHIPGLRRDAERGDACFGTVDSWLVWKLTGGTRGGRHVTDVTNASRTLLYNLEDLRWDPELLRYFDIPESLLPAVHSSVHPQAFGLTAGDGPFEAEIPITGILGDQQAALFGQTCFEKGQSKNTYGTGCFLLANTGERAVLSRHGLISTVAYRIVDRPAVYALEGSVAVAGSLVQWFRDNLGLIRSSSDIEELASSVADNGGVYCVPAFSGLFAPHWDSSARGIIAGITHSSQAAHLARAVLEATAFQTREIFDAMQRDTGLKIQQLKVDGGMVANDLLMQFQADVLGIPVLTSRIPETTALGACYAAGLATDVWRSTANLAAGFCKRWEPRMSAEKSEELFRHWRKAVERSRGWLDGRSNHGGM